MMQDPASKVPAMNQLKPSTVYISVDINDEIPMAEYKDAKFVDEHHWLKEQSLYTFTKEELEELLEGCYKEGHEYDGKQKLYALSGMNKAPNFKSMTEYIKQLLP